MYLKKPVFTGSSVALITPMHNDGSVNYEKLSQLIELQHNGGTAAITVCGTTGEAATLTDMEIIRTVSHTAETVRQRLPVIAGTGSNDTKHALFLSREAEKAGADALLLITPYYNKCSETGLIRHFLTIADSVSIPIIVYNVPSRTGVSMSAAVYKAISAHPNINGVKEASGSTDLVLRIQEACGTDLNIWSGNDSQIVPFISMGCKGIISVLANICPRETAQIASACLSGDFPSAARMQVKYMPLIDALFSDVNPIPVKTAMNLMGMEVGPLRLPLCEPEKQASLYCILKKYNLL